MGLAVLAVLACFVPTGQSAAQSPAGDIVIRSGFVSGVPASPGTQEDDITYLVRPQCYLPLKDSPLTAADFAAARSGPRAYVIARHGAWLAQLPGDPQARWINWGSTWGSPGSVLYAIPFEVPECFRTATLTLQWAADDQLGDYALQYGPNPIGAYLNETPLGAGFTGVGYWAPQTASQDVTSLLHLGQNVLYVYQRDGGCGAGGLLFSATIQFHSITLRSGLVNGAPGSPGTPEDDITCYATTPCSFAIDGSPLAAEDFARARTGAPAYVISPYGGWVQGLPGDAQARWINWNPSASTPASALYAIPFELPWQSASVALTLTWVVDDFLGDVVPAAGPNVIGAYVNGTALDPPFSGGTWPRVSEVTAEIGPLIVPGQNILYLYQRDTGCTVSGILFSAKLRLGCALALGGISGTVLADGAPLADVTVNLSAAGGHTQAAATGPDGSYSFLGVPAGAAQVSVVAPPGYEVVAPAGGVANLTVAAGQTAMQDFSLAGFADIAGTVVAGGAALANVSVDVVASGDSFIQFAVTDDNGAYRFTGVPVSASHSGTVSIVVPLGYRAVTPESGVAAVSLAAGQTSTADFVLETLLDAGPVRTIGYWKHQVNVYISGRGSAQETLAAMSTTYPELIFEHFFENQLNSIAVAGVTFLPGPPDAAMTLGSMHATLNLQRASMLERAKQQYLALLLNVASNRLRSTDVVSADGATASQVIQQIAAQINDGDAGNDEAAKDLADTLNNGLEVGAGVIDLSIPVIPFTPRPVRATLAHVHPNPMVQVAHLDFEMEGRGEVTAGVYDASGRLVRALAARGIAGARYRVEWDGRAADGRQVANGVYFFRLALPDRQIAKQVVVMR